MPRLFLALPSAFALVLCAVALPVAVPAATLHVPDEYSTIQAGVNAAEPGDTVLVAAGTYMGSGNREIEFFGKDISVIAEGGPDVTTIDGQLVSQAFIIRGGETRAARIEGFKMINCGGQVGAAISCESSSPTIANCLFTGNGTPFLGGAIYSDADPRLVECQISNNTAQRGGGLYGSFTIENCTINGNTCIRNGGGIRGSGTILNTTFMWNSAEDGGAIFGDFVVKDCTIIANQASNWGGGIVAEDMEETSIEGCLIAGNRSPLGGGVYVDLLAIVDITSTTIAGNLADELGGGIYLSNPDVMSIEKTILWGNCAFFLGNQTYGTSANLIPFICNAVDSVGIAQPELFDFIGDQVYTDPLFCDPASCASAPTTGGDYTLFSDSPCLSINSPCGELIGALPVGCPISGVLGPEFRVSGLLGAPFPNPATGHVRYTVSPSAPTKVVLRVFDVRGQLVDRLMDKVLPPGSYSFTWNPLSRDGGRLAGGAYFLQLDAGAMRETRKLILAD
jgi:predicted outer membrane repeat protein